MSSNMPSESVFKMIEEGIREQDDLLKELKAKQKHRMLARGLDVAMPTTRGEDGMAEEVEPPQRTVQRLVAAMLLDAKVVLPIVAPIIAMKLENSPLQRQYLRAMKAAELDGLDSVLQQLSGGERPLLQLRKAWYRGRQHQQVMRDVDLEALAGLAGEFATAQQAAPQAASEACRLSTPPMPPAPAAAPPPVGWTASSAAGDVQELLRAKSVHDQQQSEWNNELVHLLQKPTANQIATKERFKTEGGPSVREHCPLLTKVECRRANRRICERVHFRKVLYPWTVESLGNCCWLDTCRNRERCRYVHYVVDDKEAQKSPCSAVAPRSKLITDTAVPEYLKARPEAQWVCCDVRQLDLSILGKFGVIMADPPWEIRQELPYGTMTDDEMRTLNLGQLQDDGVMCLWVTGRAMELGRELLELWGYKRADELIWVKTTQLGGIVRTGRTGHWLNHSKEHCLIGIKGNPRVNRHVDCDVLVAPLRETSRKPDEMYSLLERLSPGTRKLEVFARKHNVMPGWIALGNQLDGTHLVDPELRKSYEQRYGSLPARVEAKTAEQQARAVAAPAEAAAPRPE